MVQPFTVAYSRDGDKWYIVYHGYKDDASTKTKAVKMAKGMAQEKADETQRTQIVEIYGKRDEYQRKVKVQPAP